MKDVCEELAMPGDALHRHGRPKSVKLKNANLVSALGWVLSVREYSDFLPTNERLSFKTRYILRLTTTKRKLRRRSKPYMTMDSTNEKVDRRTPLFISDTLQTFDKVNVSRKARYLV
jgi:hypothetical protein